MPFPLGDNEFAVPVGSSDTATGTGGDASGLGPSAHGNGKPAGYWYIWRTLTSTVIANAVTPNGWGFVILETQPSIAVPGRTDFLAELSAPIGAVITGGSNFGQVFYIQTPGEFNWHGAAFFARTLDPVTLPPEEAPVLTGTSACCNLEHTLLWTSVIEATSYELVDADTLEQLYAGPLLGIVLTNPYFDRTRSYKVRGVNGDGNGPYSDIITLEPNASQQAIAVNVVATPVGVGTLVSATTRCIG